MNSPVQAQASALRALWTRRDAAEKEALIRTIAERTSNAYSFPNYGMTAWRMCTRYLLARGLDSEQVEAFLRSKHMRWAADEAGNRYGHASSVGLRTYIAYHEAGETPFILKGHGTEWGEGWLEREARELAGETWH